MRRGIDENQIDTQRKVRDTSYKRAEHVRQNFFRKVTRERGIRGAKRKKPFLATVNRRPREPSSGHQNKKICCLFKFNTPSQTQMKVN